MCEDAFFNTDSCTKCYEACLTCSGVDSTACTMCKPGYASISSTPHITCSKITRCDDTCALCLIADVADKCVTCSEGYTFTDGVLTNTSGSACIKEIFGCVIYSSDGIKCTTCASGLILQFDSCVIQTETSYMIAVIVVSVFTGVLVLVVIVLIVLVIRICNKPKLGGSPDATSN